MTRVPPKLAAAYRTVFDSPEGKTVLADLMKLCCVLDPAAGLDGMGAIDSHRLALNEGARNVGLHIMKRMGVKPEHFVKTAHDLQDDYAKTMEGFIQ